MRKISVFFIAVFLLPLASSCLRPLRLPDQALLDTQRVLNVASEQAKQRQRLSGRFNVKSTGIKQFFGNTDIILAAQMPSSFYLSIPSFFEMPARVVTSDGSKLYLLDMGGERPQYLVESVDSKYLEDWTGISIEPAEFVEAILGIANLDEKKVLTTDIQRRHRKYSLTLQMDDKKTKVLEFDADTDDLLAQSVYLGAQLIHQIKYSEFKDYEGTRFPSHTQILVRAKEKVDLQISALEMSFPKDAFDEDTFQIEEP